MSNSGEENVECTRCGNQWYSHKFEEKEETPKNCPQCYQESVRKIPDPPTKIDKIKSNTKSKVNEIPGKVKHSKEAVRDFKEKNRMLIGLIETSLIITVITVAVIYLIFMR